MYGWIVRERKARESENGSAGDSKNESGSTLTDDYIASTVVELESTYLIIKLKRQDVLRTVSVQAERVAVGVGCSQYRSFRRKK